MLKFYFLLALSISFVLLSGCESLPPGDAPEGPIIEVQGNNDTILEESAAIEKMTTAIASSEPLITSNTPLNVILSKTNVQSDYSANATAISARVFRELINTGIIDCTTSKNPDFILTSTFVKLQKTDDGEIIFKWIMGLTNEGSSNSVFSYSLKVKVKLIASSAHMIKAEEITPTYK
ncbi:MAG: hypothetical protein WCR55_10710 [Lentisphaerota bacterium]